MFKGLRSRNERAHFDWPFSAQGGRRTAAEGSGVQGLLGTSRRSGSVESRATRCRVRGEAGQGLDWAAVARDRGGLVCAARRTPERFRAACRKLGTGITGHGRTRERHRTRQLGRSPANSPGFYAPVLAHTSNGPNVPGANGNLARNPGAIQGVRTKHLRFRRSARRPARAISTPYNDMVVKLTGHELARALLAQGEGE